VLKMLVLLLALLGWGQKHQVISIHLNSDSSRVRLGAADCSSALTNLLIYYMSLTLRCVGVLVALPTLLLPY
jgi:hypothetical protein